MLLGWLSAMESKPTDTVTVHMGTNVLDGDLSERPRIVDQINQKSVRDDWRVTWTRLFDEGHTSLASKSLVWDIDDPEDLETAFETADAIAAELSKHVSMPEQAPRVVFSGGKGFHVWVVDESAIKHLLLRRLVGVPLEGKYRIWIKHPITVKALSVVPMQFTRGLVRSSGHWILANWNVYERVMVLIGHRQ